MTALRSIFDSRPTVHRVRRAGGAFLVAAAATVAAALPAAAQPPTIQPTSIVRVRADNHFGVTKDHVINLSSFPGGFSHSILDTEIGTAASATNSATYNFSFSGTTAVMETQSTQSHTVGAVGNLTEGYIQFVLAEPYLFEVSGDWSGVSNDAGDAYQLRTFLRQFVSPFATQYLEDETHVGTRGALYVNQSDDTAGGTYNQSGPKIGVLPAGTYEFSYEMETLDLDNDQASAGSATGRVRLVLRKPLAPTRLQASVTGNALLLSWLPSSDATSYQLEAGTSAGASNLFIGDVGATTQLQASLGAGTYFVRVRTKRAGVLGPATADVTFTVGTVACSSPPPPPTPHTADTGGLFVDLGWGSAVGASSYVLEVGSATGAANLAVVNLGNRMSFQVTAPAATYFTRVRAVNACGSSAPSNEVAFTAACVGPPAPASLTFTKAGGLVTLNWASSLGATAYLLQVGTAPGASNLFSGSVGTATTLTFPANAVAAGTYYFRVAAVGACGQGAAAPELTIALP